MNYLLFGEEAATMRKKIKQIAEKEKVDMDQVSIYDAEQIDLKYILEDAGSIPFFGDRKVVLIQNATFLSPKDTTGYDLKALAAYLNDPLDSTTLILSCACAKLDQRKKIVKEFMKQCKVIECARIREYDKAETIRSMITQSKLKIDEDALRLFIDRMPLDMAIIENELAKLKLYQDKINVETIRNLTIRALEDNVFDLAEALQKKNLTKAMRLWKDLDAQQMDPIYLIATLAAQFRFLFQTKVLIDQGLTKQAIVSELAAHPYRVQMAMGQCRSYRSDSFLRQLKQLASLDQRIKSGQIDKKLGFELYLIQNGI